MPTPTLSGPLGELRSVHTTAGGNASSTTAAVIPLPRSARHVFIEGRNYSTAVVLQVALNPWLTVLKTVDNLATVTDYSIHAQDNSTTTDIDLSSLDTLANGDYLMVGSHIPFRGVVIDVDAANSNTSALTVKYRKSNNTWGDISATDGTVSTGVSLAQDGIVTWTVPTDWVTADLLTLGAGGQVANAATALYWTRWEWSAALDGSTTLNSMLSLCRSSQCFELVSGRVLETEVSVGPGGVSCVEHRTDAGTANILVNCAARFGTTGHL